MSPTTTIPALSTPIKRIEMSYTTKPTTYPLIDYAIASIVAFKSNVLSYSAPATPTSNIKYSAGSYFTTTPSDSIKYGAGSYFASTTFLQWDGGLHLWYNASLDLQLNYRTNHKYIFKCDECDKNRNENNIFVGALNTTSKVPSSDTSIAPNTCSLSSVASVVKYTKDASVTHEYYCHSPSRDVSMETNAYCSIPTYVWIHTSPSNIHSLLLVNSLSIHSSAVHSFTETLLIDELSIRTLPSDAKPTAYQSYVALFLVEARLVSNLIC